MLWLHWGWCHREQEEEIHGCVDRPIVKHAMLARRRKEVTHAENPCGIIKWFTWCRWWDPGEVIGPQIELTGLHPARVVELLARVPLDLGYCDEEVQFIMLGGGDCFQRVLHCKSVLTPAFD